MDCVPISPECARRTGCASRADRCWKDAGAKRHARTAAGCHGKAAAAACPRSCDAGQGGGGPPQTSENNYVAERAPNWGHNRKGGRSATRQPQCRLEPGAGRLPAEGRRPAAPHPCRHDRRQRTDRCTPRASARAVHPHAGHGNPKWRCGSRICPPPYQAPAEAIAFVARGSESVAESGKNPPVRTLFTGYNPPRARRNQSRAGISSGYGQWRMWR
jgi:hypothetical protein